VLKEQGNSQFQHPGANVNIPAKILMTQNQNKQTNRQQSHLLGKGV